MKKSIIIMVGFPASGKSSYVKELISKGWVNFNKDTIGYGKAFDDAIEYQLKHGNHEKIVIDNTYGTLDQRKSIVDLAKKYGYQISAWVMSTSLEEAQVNAVHRQIERYGVMMTPENKKTIQGMDKDVNMFTPAVQYAYRKQYQEPTTFEGFDEVKKIKFIRNPYGPEYKNKAVIFDYDGTLRDTISGEKYPRDPYDIKVLPGRSEKIAELKKQGYLILGVSNQSGIAKGHLDMSKARACFKKTNELLGHEIDVEFCSHSVPPIVCFCRKPSPGLGVHFIEKYKLNPAETIMVGDMTSDKTFAARCGFKYVDVKKFF